MTLENAESKTELLKEKNKLREKLESLRKGFDFLTNDKDVTALNLHCGAIRRDINRINSRLAKFQGV